MNHKTIILLSGRKKWMKLWKCLFFRQNFKTIPLCQQSAPSCIQIEAFIVHSFIQLFVSLRKNPKSLNERGSVFPLRFQICYGICFVLFCLFVCLFACLFSFLFVNVFLFLCEQSNDDLYFHLGPSNVFLLIILRPFIFIFIFLFIFFLFFLFKFSFIHSLGVCCCFCQSGSTIVHRKTVDRKMFVFSYHSTFEQMKKLKDWTLELIFTTSWAPRRCPGLFHNFIVKKSCADWSKDPAGFGLGWAPHKIFFCTNTPRGATFVCWPLPNSKKHTPPFGRVDPAGPRFGWAPHK